MTQHKLNNNLTLLAASANGSSASSTASPVGAPRVPQEKELSETMKAMIIGDMNPPLYRQLCTKCVDKLPAGDAIKAYHVRVASESCVACRILGLKPEAFTKPFCKFLEQNPTIFHAVDYFKSKSTDLGYKEV
jgi:aminopeptidase I